MVSHFWKENQVMIKKRFSIFSLLLASAATLSAQYYTPEDDIYYTPSDKNPVVEQRIQESEPVAQQVVVIDNYSSNYGDGYSDRDVDEYNRRYYYDTTSYVDSLYDNQEEEAVTYYLESNETGYYLDEFDGTATDYEYAERIRRFHNPKFTIHISDPAYTDIYFMSATGDWNVYVDGSYAWATPTWTNPMYWDYMWSPYSFSYSWGYRPWGYRPYNYGWYGGYYNSYYYGWYGHSPYHKPHYKPHHKPHYATSYRKSSTGRNTVSSRGTSSVGSTRSSGTSSSSTRSTGTSTSSSTSRTRVSTTPSSSSSSSSSGVSSSSRTRSSSTNSSSSSSSTRSSYSSSSSSSSSRSSSSSYSSPSSSSSSRSSGTSSSSSSRSSGGSSSGRR